MNPRELQSLAATLSQGNAPAALRSAVSGAYYSVFNVGVESLRGFGFLIGRGAAAHGEVQKCLVASGDSAVILVGNSLTTLHARWIRADYRLDVADVENPQSVRALVDQTAEFIRTLDAAFAGPERSNIRAAILSWRRANGYPT